MIIMTSNVGIRDVENFGTGLGFETETSESSDDRRNSIIKKALNKKFAPEFLNRLDDIIMFNNLQKEEIGQIVEIELKKLSGRLVEMGYELNVDKSAKEFLIENGYDERFGARPLTRAIQKHIEDPISEDDM